MTDHARLPTAAADARGSSAVDHRRRWVLTGSTAILAAAVLAAAVIIWFTMPRAPGDDSLEAGFARDMIVHHDQAVTMALQIRDRTTDPVIRALATDIMLTQQNQIGQMLGWLNVWGLSATSAQPPMAWMGQRVPGAMGSAATPGGTGDMPGMGTPAPAGKMMPGMATPEELVHLAQLSGDAADAEFLRLMIRHHRGAIPMARAALERSGNRALRALTGGILSAQEAEITAMEDLLKREPRSGAQP